MNLEEINAKESAQNVAFGMWVGDNREFFNLPKSKQLLLCDYVAGLNREIADLEAEKYSVVPPGSYAQFGEEAGLIMWRMHKHATRLERERDHWKDVARRLIRTYRVDDQAWDHEKEADRLLEREAP